MIKLSRELRFPPVHLADANGVLAMGGDCRPERIMLAYQKGVFPWYSDETPILWWSPDPRFVLYPDDLHIGKNLRRLLRQNKFKVTFDTHFADVIDECQKIERPGQDGTWITDDLKESYIKIHEMGFAHSAEVWKEGELVGGLYGVNLGKVYFGESMFSKVSNASKVGFATLMHYMVKRGIELVDCQVHTDYLEQFGARNISRSKFMTNLDILLDFDSLNGKWTNDSE